MTAPTWQELRDAGAVVFDEPGCALAVYPAGEGGIVIAIKSADGTVHRVGTTPAGAKVFGGELAGVAAFAAQAAQARHEHETAIAAYELIQRAKGAA